MKFSFGVCLLLGMNLSLQAQDPVVPPVVGETAVIGTVADGTPSLPAPVPVKPDFKVKSSFTRRVFVKEAPEMPELPPVKGMIDVTVQLVEDPHIPDPPPAPPLPPSPPDDTAVPVNAAEAGDDNGSVELVFLSASVFDHKKTRLHWYSNVASGNGMTAWSNLDFNQFSGFSSYQVKQPDGGLRNYGLMMGIGNEDTANGGTGGAAQGGASDVTGSPALPDLATQGPAFVVTEGDTSDRRAMEIIEGLHELYRVEGARMQAAYQARTKAREERKAWLLANPPVPKDVLIQVWKRDNPIPSDAQPQQVEGQP